MTSSDSRAIEPAERLSLAEEQRRADDADRLRRVRPRRPAFPLSYLFRN